MSNERGSALPLVGLALVLVMVVAMVLGAITERVVFRARAQSAADAAALAGVIEGVDAADDLARRNGADLVRFERRDAVVVVVVDYRGITAEAYAEAVLELD